MKILKIILRTNVVVPEEFGFRDRHSSSYKILWIIEYVFDGLQNKQPTGAILLDLKMAFDIIYLDGLLFKIIKLNIPDTLITLLNSYLFHRNVKVCVNNSLSSSFRISAGVRYPWAQSCVPPSLMSISIIFLVFLILLALCADGTDILSTTCHTFILYQNFQSHIRTFEEWSEKWRIKLNSDKIQTIFFSSKRKHPPKI